MAEDYPRTLLELERRFVSEKACRQYLLALRWGEGLACPWCGFRINRDKSASREQLFYHSIQQAMQVELVPFASLTKSQPLGGG